MKYALTKDNIVVQVQPHYSDGFIKVDETVMCGMVKDGDNFSSPEKTQEQIKSDRIREIKSELIDLDFKRIRPTAEGDEVYLQELNDEVLALREELQGLLS